MYKSKAEINLEKPNMDGSNNQNNPIYYTYHIPAGDATRVHKEPLFLY